MFDSILLIQSSNEKNKSMGTGFVCYVDSKGSYILTCSHVVADVQTPKINGIEAQIIANGADQDIDLALLYLKDFKSEPLELQQIECSSREMELIGYSHFDKKSYQAKPKKVTLLEEVKLQQKSNSTSQKSWEIVAKEHYHIESGNSGSPLFCLDTHNVIAVVSNNQTTKRGYAISVEHLRDIWHDMPQKLLNRPQSKADFSQEVFSQLDTNPLLLFSTDSYNHTDYIEHIKADAIEIFGKSVLIDINCGRFANIKEVNKFFGRLAKKLKLPLEVEDSIDFEDAIIEQFEKLEPLKSFILVTGFERLTEDVRDAFAETLRNLQEEYSKQFNLVIFGGKRLIKLKYQTGIHSYFNMFDEKMIPPPSFWDWKKKFDYLSTTTHNEVIKVTGGCTKLTKFCFEKQAINQKEAKKILDESSWKSELFRLYRKDNLCLLLDKDILGDAHPYSDNELLYRLYWDNLIVEQRGKFVWRSKFICELGRRFLGC